MTIAVKNPLTKMSDDNIFTRSICTECDGTIMSSETAYAVLLYTSVLTIHTLNTPSTKHLFCSGCASFGLKRCTDLVTVAGNGITAMQLFRTFGSLAPVSIQ